MSSRQLTLPISRRVQLNFHNFVVGSHSQLIGAAKALVSSKGFGFVYFYGLSGAGKSHLHYAVSDFAADSEQYVQYLSFDQESDLDRSLSLSDKLEMLEHLQTDQIVCLDDLDKLAGNLEAERAIFSVFERCRVSGGQLLVSALAPPDKAGFILKDLVSRLSSADVFALKEMDDEARLEAAQLRSQQMALSLSPEALTYLINRLPRDNRSLFDFIETLDQASLAEKRRITIPFLKTLIDG